MIRYSLASPISPSTLSEEASPSSAVRNLSTYFDSPEPGATAGWPHFTPHSAFEDLMTGAVQQTGGPGQEWLQYIEPPYTNIKAEQGELENCELADLPVPDWVERLDNGNLQDNLASIISEYY